MDRKKIETLYSLWRKNAAEDDDLAAELIEMEGDEKQIEDAFYCDLKFGTGGLRGVTGAGTSRMNIYTVRKASQGVANYVLRSFPASQRRIAVSYDSRIKSETFARETADVFAANEIEVMIYEELMPTPCLSFAVRELHCAAGIMITASHNPAEYNGYKVYGADGCQITTEAARIIQEEMDRVDLFDGVKQGYGMSGGRIRVIPPKVYDDFIGAVKDQAFLESGTGIRRDLPIVYTPLNGTGRKPVLRVLGESGFRNITVVREQELPDGAFPTCPYPNPEVEDAMQLGVQYAEKIHADLVLATDPDCDRVGIAVRDNERGYRLLSGNETGILLLDYICAKRKQSGSMPEHPVFVKTIVTTGLAARIAAHYGLETIDVLTGFKFIGEQIGRLEQDGRKEDYVFGFEESCGYLSGTYVRDKDAVNASLLICEMFAEYKAQGKDLIDKLRELYQVYGYTVNEQHSYLFEGAQGIHKIQELMNTFRAGCPVICGMEPVQVLDYSLGIAGLPKSDVIKIALPDDCSVILRPSGTEPKLKIYAEVTAASAEEAVRLEKELIQTVEEALFANSFL